MESVKIHFTHKLKEDVEVIACSNRIKDRVKLESMKKKPGRLVV